MSNTEPQPGRRGRRRAAANQAELPEVPNSVFGRVLCAHPELLTIPLAFVLIFGFYSPVPVVAVVGVCVLLFAWGWSSLMFSPAEGRKTALLSVVGLVNLVLCTIYLEFSLVCVVAALGVIAAFILELTRNPRPRLVPSLAATVSGVLLVTSGAGWVILQNDDLWRLLYITAGVTMLGACLGMALSASWSPPLRAAAVLTGALLFALASGGVLAVLQRWSAAKVALLTGGFVPSIWLTLICSAVMGLLVGGIFALLRHVFSGPTAPRTVGGGLALSVAPVLLSALPFYVLARLLVDTAQVW